MSNQYLKLRRSNVQGKIPTTESIDFGEIALNTFDGKAYMKVSGSDGIKVVEIGSTATGSFNFNSGSYVTTSSFNNFTASYNTGSFSGSLIGTASWAESASYAVFANDYNFTSSVLEYYVDRRFSGGCGVTIGSNRIITSTNANYLTQLSASRTGDPNHPYPDPWSAGFIASASIAAGQITSARVIIKTGNEYTYGSSTLAQNGDITGSLVSNFTPDIAVSQIDYNNRVFDLLSPMIEYYFEPETALYNINKSWTQELIVYTSSNWDIAPEFKITGKGKFVLVYGSAQGLVARYGRIHSPRAKVIIEADHLYQNMSGGWNIIARDVNINLNKLWSYPASIFEINRVSSIDLYSDAFWNWPSQSLVYPSYSIGMPIANININEMRWGFDLFSGIAPSAASTPAGFLVGHPYGTTYNFNIKNLRTRGAHFPGFFRLSYNNANLESASINNARIADNTVNIDINYISSSAGVLGNTWRGGQLFQLPTGGGTPGTAVWYGVPKLFYENCNFFVNINKMESFGVGLGNNQPITNVSNCVFKINCSDYRNYSRIYQASGTDSSCAQIIFNFLNSSSLSPQPSGSYRNNQVIISGNYRNYSTGSLVTFGSANLLGDDGSIGTTLLLDNFNGYQLNEVNIADGYAPITIRNWSVFNPPYVFSTGSMMIVKDSTIYVSGSTSVFTWNNEGLPNKVPTILLNNVSSNKDISGNFNFEGSLNISSNIANIAY